MRLLFSPASGSGQTGTGLMKKAVSEKERSLQDQLKGARAELVAGDAGMLHYLHLTGLDFHCFYVLGCGEVVLSISY